MTESPLLKKKKKKKKLDNCAVILGLSSQILCTEMTPPVLCINFVIFSRKTVEKEREMKINLLTIKVFSSSSSQAFTCPCSHENVYRTKCHYNHLYEMVVDSFPLLSPVF